MFSNRGRSVEEDTVEYGWLLEVQAGTVTGRLTAAQVQRRVRDQAEIRHSLC